MTAHPKHPRSPLGVPGASRAGSWCIGLVFAAVAVVACVEFEDPYETDTRFVLPPGDAGDTDAPPSDVDPGDVDFPETEDPDAGDTDVGDETPEERTLTRIDIAIEGADLAFLHNNPQTQREVDVEARVDGVRYDDCEIEIHGGFARSVPKLSYRLKFKGDELLETDVFGGAPEQHRRIVLQASWIDTSFLRNCVTFDLVRRLGGLAPRCGHAEVYFNGSYQGLFLVLERVDEVFMERNGLAPDGLLVKASNHDADWGPEENPLDGFELHGNESAPTDGLGTLLEVIHETPADFESFEAQVAPWLSIDDFLAWQLAHTLADNRDTFTKNYYLHHDWAAGAPFRIISWDADATWGITWNGDVVDPSEQTRLWGNDRFSPRLFSIPAYRQAYEDWYADVVAADEWQALVLEVIDQHVDRMGTAAERDLAAWERGVTHAEAVEALRNAVSSRFSAMRGAASAVVDQP